MWSKIGDSAANVALTLTKTGVAGIRYRVTSFEVVVLAAAVSTADVDVEVRNGSTVIWKSALGAATARGTRFFWDLSTPLDCSRGADCTLFAGAAGAGVVLRGAMGGFEE